MSSRVTKRARRSTNGTSAPDRDFDRKMKISKLVQTFDREILAALLTALGEQYPETEEVIKRMACLLIGKEPEGVVEFKKNVKSVWKTLCSHLSSDTKAQRSTLYTKATIVLDSIRHIQVACHGLSSCETKLDGLQALLKIGKIICLSCKESVTLEVLEMLRRDTVFEDTIFDIVLSLTVGGTSSAMTSGQKDALRDRSVGGLMYEMVEVNGMGAEIGVFESLRSSIKLLEGTLRREEAVVIDLEEEVVLDVKEEM